MCGADARRATASRSANRGADRRHCRLAPKRHVQCCGPRSCVLTAGRANAAAQAVQRVVVRPARAMREPHNGQDRATHCEGAKRESTCASDKFPHRY